MSAEGAPLEVTEDLITTFNITTVVRGSISETGHSGDDGSRYAVPHKRGIFRCARRWNRSHYFCICCAGTVTKPSWLHEPMWEQPVPS